jgi:hypothetical protein
METGESSWYFRTKHLLTCNGLDIPRLLLGAVLPIFVSIPCLFHYLCYWSESCLGCLIYISCLFLAFYSLFVFHAISTQLDRYINVYKKNKSKLAVIFLIVFIHQLLCIENTKEQLPDMILAILCKKTSPASGGSPDPLFTGSFFSGYAPGCRYFPGHLSSSTRLWRITTIFWTRRIYSFGDEGKFAKQKCCLVVMVVIFLMKKNQGQCFLKRRALPIKVVNIIFIYMNIKLFLLTI